MKKKKILQDCRNDDKNQIVQGEFDCIMEFIASKMQCKNELEKYYYPEHYPSCQSKEDLKFYFETRIKIYNGSYDNELKHCFEKRCIEESWTADYQTPITRELLHETWQIKEQDIDTTAMFFFQLQHEVNSIIQSLILYIATSIMYNISHRNYEVTELMYLG